MLRIEFLGTPVISTAAGPIVELTQAPAVLRLFAFLVMHRQQPQHRSGLAGLFWQDTSEERARRNLNNLFWRLRALLPNADAFFVYDKQTIQFNAYAPYWLDVVEFDCATQALTKRANHLSSTEMVTPDCLAAFEQTLGLYRGAFLRGIDEDWCLVHRTQWHERYLHALENFVELCRACGELARALPKAQQLAALDPYRESVHQRLIECYLALERPVAARTQFEQYEQLWRTELKLAPSASMLALAQRHGWRSAVVAPPIVTPLDDNLAVCIQDHPAYLRRQLEICCKNDELYDLMADRQRQQENLLLAQALVDKLQAPASQIEILARRTWLAIHQGDYAEALDLAQTGLDLCEQTRQTEHRAWLHRLIGVTSEEMGNFKAALHHYTKALQCDEAQNVLTYMPANLNNVAATQLTLAQYCPAIQLLERAQTLLAVQPAPRMEVMIVGNLGYAWLKLSQLDQANHSLQQALTLAGQLGDRSTEWWLASVVAKLYHLRGETARALTFALHHYRTARPAGDAWVLTYLADTLALLYADQQNGAASLQWAQWMWTHAVQKKQWRYQVRALLRLAQAHRLLGHADTAFDLMIQAIQQYTGQQQPIDEEPELFATYAIGATAVGHPQLSAEAAQHAQQALHAQLAAIPDCGLRQSFLRVQRLPCELLQEFQMHTDLLSHR